MRRPSTSTGSAWFERFGRNFRVLLAHLILYGFVYPSERSRIPQAVLRGLVARLDEPSVVGEDERVCLGTLLSRSQYQPDLDWGYTDGRLPPHGTMSPEDIVRWTAAADVPRGARRVSGERTSHRGEVTTSIRFSRTLRFWTALLLALYWCGLHTSPAAAGLAPSQVSGATSIVTVRDADLQIVQRSLESKVVAQKLRDYGVAPDEVQIKLASTFDEISRSPVLPRVYPWWRRSRGADRDPCRGDSRDRDPEAPEQGDHGERSWGTARASARTWHRSARDAAPAIVAPCVAAVDPSNALCPRDCLRLTSAPAAGAAAIRLPYPS